MVALVEDALRSESLPLTTFGTLDPGAVVVAKTVDRKVLGCMVDVAYLCSRFIATYGGLDHCDLDELNSWLRRAIHSTTGYVPPIELLRALAESD